jgi:hypothetical protein|uniref:Uncharacterized protein n=1 Tax=Siphoviridae sp. ctksc2 TaxID=2825645 RepID=A0A8S5URW3_9CAUD|nr:MAG TPA: hypothetical protein [Siphoviridae sp. ctksc2]
MTPEMTQTALAAVAEETVKAAVKRSLTITMMGHATAIAGIAAGLPAADATEAIGQVIGMLTESRDAIGDMK